MGKKIIKSIRNIFLMLLALLLIGILVVHIMHDRFVFFPTDNVLQTPQSLGLNYEELDLKINKKDTIKAWYLIAPDVGTDKVNGGGKIGEKVILYFYSGATNMSQEIFRFYIANNDWNFNVLILDYPGYGFSSGKPSEKKLYQSAEAAWDFLVNDKNINSDNIIVIGHGLGTVPACHLASKVGVKNLVLQSSFTKYSEIDKYSYPKYAFFFSLVFGSSYNNLKKLKNYTGSVLFFHSPDDERINYKLGRDLFNLYSGRKEFVDLIGGHSEVDANFTPLFISINEFFNLKMENKLTRSIEKGLLGEPAILN